MATPPTTELTVIFPSSEYFFDMTYKPSLTDDKVTTEQVKQVLTFLTRTSEEKLKPIEMKLMFLTFFAVVVGGAIFYLRDDKVLFTDGMIIFCGLILPIFVFLVWKRNKIKSEVHRICQEYLDEENQKLAGVGVRWCLPKCFPSLSIAWAELHNDFKRQSPSIAIHEGGTVEFTIIQAQNGGPHNYNPPQQYN